MRCERWREMLSAQLDGEDDPADRERTDEHLGECAGCRAWLDSAAAVNRLTRTGLAVPVPDLSAAILAALPQPADAAQRTGAPHVADAAHPAGAAQPAGGGAGGVSPGRRRLTGALFAALGAVGAVQLMLGVAQVGQGGAVDHEHPGVDLAATPGHLWHESAAWNVAVGAAFLVMALRRSRPTGLVPMLSAFVGMLLLLSVNDLTAGRVEADRLVSHGFVIAGYLIVVALSRVTAGPHRPPAGDRPAGAGWRARFDDAAPAQSTSPTLRLVRRGGPATAHLSSRDRAA